VHRNIEVGLINANQQFTLVSMIQS